ncbi:hypothetical protein PR048_001914 [Dryococelus australis]|uniref:Uncharacterized protein n=1 Tax=Dryococelus australis TaxID=614101 RepID=A0ABQ9IIN9_9NEOP|nr:hypothetical protein PR048_001914 [Dryococelus australis]
MSAEVGFIYMLRKESLLQDHEVPILDNSNVTDLRHAALLVQSVNLPPILSNMQPGRVLDFFIAITKILNLHFCEEKSCCRLYLLNVRLIIEDMKSDRGFFDSGACWLIPYWHKLDESVNLTKCDINIVLENIALHVCVHCTLFHIPNTTEELHVMAPEIKGRLEATSEYCAAFPSPSGFDSMPPEP